jgi:hypothetical protein
MENISVNNLVESTNSNLPRDIKIEFAKIFFLPLKILTMQKKSSKNQSTD